VDQSPLSAEQCASIFERIVNNVAQVVHGKAGATRTAVATLLAGGHLLIEDVPGVGKTSLAKALAASVECSWKRVQFTPDLLPSDLIGVNIYRRSDETFRFSPGPLFANIVLADEINRASPKTQSALLEAMEERQITVDGTSHSLPDPFMVIATQNPIESDGTYRLPESQIDRFMSRISLGYPDAASEVQMLDDQGSSRTLGEIDSVVDAATLAAIIDHTRQIHISDALKRYLVAVTTATRSHPGVQLGLSPRATLQLAATTRARAVAAGRTFAIPEDVAEAAIPTLAHRLTLSPESASRSGPDGVITDVLHRTPVPLGN
jgi:MoxR-like ATPase